MVILTAALVFWRGGTFGVVSDAVCPYEKARVWFNRTVLVRLKALAARSSNAARCAMLEREVERLRLDADRVPSLSCTTVIAIICGLIIISIVIWKVKGLHRSRRNPICK